MKQAEAEQQKYLIVQTTSSLAGVDDKVFHFSNAQIQTQHHQTEEMKSLVLIDSQSTMSIYCNRALVKNFRSEKRLKLITKGDVLETNLMAKVDGFHKRLWFHNH